MKKILRKWKKIDAHFDRYRVIFFDFCPLDRKKKLSVFDVQKNKELYWFCKAFDKKEEMTEVWEWLFYYPFIYNVDLENHNVHEKFTETLVRMFDYFMFCQKNNFSENFNSFIRIINQFNEHYDEKNILKQYLILTKDAFLSDQSRIFLVLKKDEDKLNLSDLSRIFSFLNTIKQYFEYLVFNFAMSKKNKEDEENARYGKIVATKYNAIFSELNLCLLNQIDYSQVIKQDAQKPLLDFLSYLEGLREVEENTIFGSRRVDLIILRYLQSLRSANEEQEKVSEINFDEKRFAVIINISRNPI